MRTLIALVTLLPSVALAGGYAIPNADPRELALAQSTVAAQKGPAAIYQNSAALAGTTGLALSVSGELLSNKTTWTGTTTLPGSASIDNHPNFPPTLFLSYGDKVAGIPVALGAGFLVVGGGSLFWPADWTGAYRIQRVQQMVYLGQAGGAVEPIEGVKVGATLLYYRVTQDLRQKINFLSSDADAQLGLLGDAWSYGLSTELHAPGIPVTLGVDYRRQGKLTSTGHAHFAGVPAPYQPLLQDQGVTAAVTVPSELFVGLAWKATEQLTVMGTWSWEQWSVYKQDAFIGDKGFSVIVPRNYKNATVYRFGVEYEKPDFMPALTLRVGVLRSISDQPTDTVSPTLSDGKSWAPSVGVGYDLGSGVRADLGYQYAFFDKVKVTGTEAFPGSYDTTVHMVSVGITYHTAP